MSSQQYRDMFAQGMIVLALCAGAPIFLLSPLKNELGRARASLDEAEKRTISSAETAGGAYLDIASRIRERKRNQDACRKLSCDPGIVYERLLDAAARAEVSVNGMQPLRSGAGSLGVLGYSIEAEGSYSGLGEFLESVNTEMGFSGVTSFRLFPYQDGDRRLVRASISTKHYRFDPVRVDAVAGVPEDGGGDE